MFNRKRFTFKFNFSVNLSFCANFVIRRKQILALDHNSPSTHWEKYAVPDRRFLYCLGISNFQAITSLKIRTFMDPDKWKFWQSNVSKRRVIFFYKKHKSTINWLIVGKNHPIFMVHWHPLKAQFEWRGDLNISHSVRDVLAGQYFANFFMKQGQFLLPWLHST